MISTIYIPTKHRLCVGGRYKYFAFSPCNSSFGAIVEGRGPSPAISHMALMHVQSFEVDDSSRWRASHDNSIMFTEEVESYRFQLWQVLTEDIKQFNGFNVKSNLENQNHNPKPNPNRANDKYLENPEKTVGQWRTWIAIWIHCSCCESKLITWSSKLHTSQSLLQDHRQRVFSGLFL